MVCTHILTNRQISDVRRTESPKMFLVSSCGCFCPIFWSHVLSWEWRCSWSSAERRGYKYIWVINILIVYKGASYIRYFTVVPFCLRPIELWQHNTHTAQIIPSDCCEVKRRAILNEHITSYIFFVDSSSQEEIKQTPLNWNETKRWNTHENKFIAKKN